MNLKAIIAATPWLRRLWRFTPAPLRIPLLAVALLVGAWYVLTGRHRDDDQDSTGQLPATSQGPPPPPS